MKLIARAVSTREALSEVVATRKEVANVAVFGDNIMMDLRRKQNVCRRGTG